MSWCKNNKQHVFILSNACDDADNDSTIIVACRK